MKKYDLEDITFNLSFPSWIGNDVRCVEVGFRWRSKNLIFAKLSLSEFSLALSSLQGRPLIDIDFNRQTLEEFLDTIKMSLPTTTIIVSDTSTQKERRVSVVGRSHNNTTTFTESYTSIGNDYPFTSLHEKDLQNRFPNAKLDVRSEVRGRMQS